MVTRRPHVVIVGEPPDAAAVLTLLPSAPLAISVAPAGVSAAVGLRRSPDLLLVVVHRLPIVLPHVPLAGPSPTWIAWNRSDRSDVSVAAYAAGARCVLPAHAPGPVFASVLAAALGPIPNGGGPPMMNGPRRHYARGERLLLEPDQVLHVETGVIAQRVVQRDGTEVLIGLNGPTQLVLGHPDDSCCLDLVAHEESIVTVRTWGEAVRAELLVNKLRARLRQLEAWSAVQARPYLTARIVGLLSLLAEQFGRPHPEGILVDVRLTHGQLASATGSTRATITRALGQLRKRRLVWTVGDGAAQRFGMRELEPHGHAEATSSRRELVW